MSLKCTWAQRIHVLRQLISYTEGLLSTEHLRDVSKATQILTRTACPPLSLLSKEMSGWVGDDYGLQSPKGCLLLFLHPQMWQNGARANSLSSLLKGSQKGVKWYVHPGGDALQQEVHAAQHHLTARGALRIHEAGRSLRNSSG